MTMSIANTFPFFEADQVLTNNHLNSLFNYLDQQERLSRSKLIGSGIVCGLEISHTNDAINITKGCGLTSQGYIILLCDHTGANAYKYYSPFVKPAFPNDLEIISQCAEPDLTNIPFYASANTGTSAAPDDIQLLLTQDDFNALTDNSKAILLSQGGDLSKYAVVLFLDVNELKLKNCDTNDCNDKGSQMDFEVKALLVNKNLLISGNNNGNGKLTFSPVELRRYNVPANNLNSSDDVLNAFVSLLTADSILDTLAKDLNYCFTTYNPLLNGLTNYSFGSGADFKKTLDFIRLSFPIYLQYVYDFIYDLIKAIDEFRYKAHFITSECCGDEMKFPFHLTLGEAATNTATATSAYRQYFIYSPLFDSQGGGASELRSLLMRMILMHQGFLLVEKSIRKGLPQDIRITPSAYGRNFISDRCIPYYYKTVHDNNDLIAEDLYYYWSYGKTERGNAQRNLSYDPSAYTNANAIINPLNYDIEWYNFFRIEGHIGQPVTTALPDLISKKQKWNLPFDVIALSADYIGALLQGDDPKCIIQDLESDYRILIAEFICKLHDGFCTAARQKFTPPVQIFTPGLFNVNPATSAAKKAPANKKTSSTTPSSAAESAIFKPVSIAIDHPFISGLVNEFQATATYTKGDTLSRLCSPADGTVGSYYINSVKANQGKFVNPDPNNPINNALFQFVDSIESMLQVFMTQDLPSIDPTSFKSLYAGFEKATNVLKDVVLALINDLQNKDNPQDLEIDYLTDLLLNNAQAILQTCIAEKLEALKNEYLRRVAQYRLAKNFNYYFKRHGGLEHKAGVPRAGTFILVYHEERRKRFIDVNSLFINKELSSVLLTNFRELLQPDVDLDTQEAKTKLLAVTTLYKDPSLYLQFKNVMQEYLDNCNDLPPDKKNQITTIINQPPATPTYQLTDGMVIADFYVPYMCCSDCLPIAYILPEPAASAPLQVSQSDPVCDQEGKNFTVTLTVTGGVPPYSYTVNNTASSNNQITLASGSPDTDVIIKDTSNKTITATIKSHKCSQPCNLPCNGLSENCKYILWLPKPKDVLKDAIKHITRRALLTLTDEKGADTQIDLTGLFRSIIDKAKITEKTFDAILAKLVDAINSEVKGKAPDFLGNDKPMFTYDAESPAKFQNLTLDIERFTCHNLKLEIEASIAFTTQNQFKFDVVATYDNNAVLIQLKSEQQNFEFKVPKFDCTSIDKCAGTNNKLCKDKLQIKEINASKDAAGNLSFTFKTAPAAPMFDTYFWYFHFGNPIFSTNATPVISVQTVNPFFVRVIGINSKSGCYAILEQTLNLG